MSGKGLKGMTGGNKDVDQVSEARLWKSLDGIAGKLTEIEDKLSHVVRLEERVSNHNEVLGRYGRRLDEHGGRIREVERWQDTHNDHGNERRLEELDRELRSAIQDLDDLKRKGLRREGQRDVTKQILGWTAGIFGAIIVYLITQG